MTQLAGGLLHKLIIIRLVQLVQPLPDQPRGLGDVLGVRHQQDNDDDEGQFGQADAQEFHGETLAGPAHWDWEGEASARTSSFSMAAKAPSTPLTKRGALSEPNCLASSTASLMATLIGVERSTANSQMAMRRMLRSTTAIWSSGHSGAC